MENGTIRRTFFFKIFSSYSHHHLESWADGGSHYQVMVTSFKSRGYGRSQYCWIKLLKTRKLHKFCIQNLKLDQPRIHIKHILWFSIEIREKLSFSPQNSIWLNSNSMIWIFKKLKLVKTWNTLEQKFMLKIEKLVNFCAGCMLVFKVGRF